MSRTSGKAARASYKVTHWGQEGRRGAEALRVARFTDGDALPALGDLVSLVYRTRKGFDVELVEYEHAFATPLPRLVYDPKSGLLLIAGGKYRVGERGIVG